MLPPSLNGKAAKENEAARLLGHDLQTMSYRLNLNVSVSFRRARRPSNCCDGGKVKTRSEFLWLSVVAVSST